MSKNIARWISGAVVALCCLGLVAQETIKPMTNADVAGLVKTGLPGQTIALAIRFATETRGTNFDVSPRAMVDMERQGADSDVLDAMRAMAATQPKMTANDQGAQATSEDSMFPYGTGVFYRGASGMVPLAPSTMWPAARGTWKEMLAVGKRDWAMEVPAAHAVNQISDARPTFYLRGIPSESGNYLLKVSSKRYHREFRVSGDDTLARATRFNDADLKPVQYARVSPNLYTLRPTSDLEPGEYMIVSSAIPGQRWILLGYDFGVRR